ncbi:MAG: formylglycine-generating enzyme family protein [Pseudomonadota bacterium]
MEQAPRHFLILGAAGAFAACSQTAPIPSIEPDWVAIEGGCFTLGEKPRYIEEGPPTPVCVKPFEIARTEVTNAQFAAFVEATGYRTRAERGWGVEEAGSPGMEQAPGSAVFTGPTGGPVRSMSWWQMIEGANWRNPTGAGSDIEGRDNEPVVHVTREDAQAYALWAGGRLPTEAEWEYAARAAPDGEVSPWSDVDYVGTTDKANTWQGVFPVRNMGKDGFEGVATVASFPANAFGLYDMIGNVWEWTATPYAPTHAERDITIAGERGFDPGQPGAAVGAIKGGSYLCADNYCARFRPAARQAQDLSFGTSHIGFRIVRDVGE